MTGVTPLMTVITCRSLAAGLLCLVVAACGTVTETGEGPIKAPTEAGFERSSTAQESPPAASPSAGSSPAAGPPTVGSSPPADASPTAASPPTTHPSAGWNGQVLTAPRGVDFPTQVASDGQQIVAVLVGEEGLISGFATDDGGRLQPGSPTATGIEFLSFGGVVRTGDGWYALGSGGTAGTGKDRILTSEVAAFSSPDGRSWQAVDAVGFDGPADVGGLARTQSGRLIGVGTRRNVEDAASGGFEPLAWYSDDGRAWTTVALPPIGEGWVHGIEVVGDTVFAVGQAAGIGVLWSSTDDGITWGVTRPDGLPESGSWDHMAQNEGVVVMSGTRAAGGLVLFRSTDGGKRWSEAGAPPPTGRGEGIPFPLFTGGQRFFTLGYSFVQAFAEPTLCYADIALCRQDLAVALYASDDGDRWRRIDTSGIGLGEAGEIDGITGTDFGWLVAYQLVTEGLAAWTWPAGVPLPVGEEPVDPTTDVEVLGEGDVPQPGRRYGRPLYIHCGMDWLYVGGRPWQRSDGGLDVETGAADRIPDDWPVAQQTIFGFITLVEDDLIEYSIGDGEVIATYIPATQEPPGCM